LLDQLALLRAEERPGESVRSGGRVLADDRPQLGTGEAERAGGGHGPARGDQGSPLALGGGERGEDRARRGPPSSFQGRESILAARAAAASDALSALPTTLAPGNGSVARMLSRCRSVSFFVCWALVGAQESVSSRQTAIHPME